MNIFVYFRKILLFFYFFAIIYKNRAFKPHLTKYSLKALLFRACASFYTEKELPREFPVRVLFLYI
ncbi:hypothetical protein CLOM621_07317 [Clostridium sp. M62/1]|nr:hypothetical protein CLOM621_07317 [Clostridium sp. M62/1]